MNCHEVRQHFPLYFDSEGDAELHFRINEHLGMCPACAEWFSKQARLEGLIQEKLRSAPAAPQLWDRVLKRSGLVKPARQRRWAWLSGMAACLALVALVIWWTFFRGPSADLAKLTADWHARIVDGQVEVDYRSQSDRDVERYLRQRVSFPVRCPPRQDVGFAVEGAGVCKLQQQTAAYLTGQVEKAAVSIFILPRDELAQFPHQWQALQQEKTHRCREGAFAMVLRVIDQNAVLVIGQLDQARLERVLNAYGTYADNDI